MVGEPLFTVLLPTHNRADTLEIAIRSVMAQTLNDFELLVVGDGCTDRSKDVTASMQDARLRWFDFPKAPHFGYANRNRALRHARGTYVAYMAHDDLWFPDHLELLARELSDNDIEFAYTLPLWIAPDGGLALFDVDLNVADARETFLRVRSVIPSNCVAHRRDCFDRYGYWSEDLPEAGDWDLWKRIIRSGGRKVGVVRVPTSLHFRAIWKTEANAGPPELRIWNAMHKVPKALPSTMRLAGQEEALQQLTVWKNLADSHAWIRQLRKSLPYVLLRFRIFSWIYNFRHKMVTGTRYLRERLRYAWSWGS